MVCHVWYAMYGMSCNVGWHVWRCLWWATGWLGQCVALAGFINEGMEEGEAGVSEADLGGLGAGSGRGSLWPDLLMKE